jgi:hypothetical protein
MRAPISFISLATEQWMSEMVRVALGLATRRVRLACVTSRSGRGRWQRVGSPARYAGGSKYCSGPTSDPTLRVWFELKRWRGRNGLTENQGVVSSNLTLGTTMVRFV